MAKYKLEYIWLDGYEPVPNLRSKTKIVEYSKFPKLDELPWWGFDGSSTRQAEGKSSDCMLKPVAVYPDTTRKNGALVMCEVYMPDMKTPHPSNARATILDDSGAWFGFEQEYFFWKDNAPLGFPGGGGYPYPQGEYYTGVGFKGVGCTARELTENRCATIARMGGLHVGHVNFAHHQRAIPAGGIGINRNGFQHAVRGFAFGLARRAAIEAPPGQFVELRKLGIFNDLGFAAEVGDGLIAVQPNVL